MKIHTLPLPALVFAIAALPLAAQTTAAHPAHSAVHHTATGEHHYATGGCVRLPEMSPKIPALPAGLPCAKPLYTLTRTPDIHLDYASPLLSPDVREALASEKSTYSLAYVDTKVGTGPLMQPKKYLTVHYTGYLSDGTKFDSSVDRGEPITFPYGQHRVIPGWDTGFEGMHIGGKRRLYVPYELAYGEAGRAPVIPAKAELIFDVELIAQSDEMPKQPPMPGRRPSAPQQPVRPPSGTTAPATPPPSSTTPSSTPPPSSTTPPPSSTTPQPSATATSPSASKPQQ
jgi:peptidylprolyl isomerase